jgi:hypothetical protein
MTEKVKHVLKTLSTRGPMENLQNFTSFRTRRTAPNLFLPLFADPISDYLSHVKSPTVCNVYATELPFTDRPEKPTMVALENCPGSLVFRRHAVPP